MEGDDRTASPHRIYNSFQSTPSAWRETLLAFSPETQTSYFNPLPPHGGRLPGSSQQYKKVKISIHSLRMEGDAILSPVSFYFFSFQSTPSAWRETCPVDCPTTCRTFQSTPSAWRETSFGQGIALRSPYFNPLPPHGGRLAVNDNFSA